MSEKGSYRVVLKNKPFLALWLAQIFSQLGDRVCFVVFVAVIAQNIGNSTTYQSWLYVAFTIPAILLTVIAGVFIDRWNKKYTLIITNLFRAMLLLLLPFIDSSLFGIYALAFMVSSITQFFVPAEAACIPMLVNKNQLLQANSLFTTTMMASIIFGFVLGDPLINMFGIDLVHYGISMLFFISALFLLFLKETKNLDEKPHESVGHFLEDLKQGLIYVKDTPIVLNGMIKLAILFSTVVALCILSISISTQMLYPDNPAYGAQKFVYIVAASGIGMVIGSFAVAKVFKARSKYMLIFSGFLLIGVSLSLLAFVEIASNKIRFSIDYIDCIFFTIKDFAISTRMVYTYIIAGIVGFGAALAAIPVQTILQTSIPENIRGKVFGVQFTLLSTSSTLPVLLAAFGADIIGVSAMLFIIGVPLSLFGIYNLYNYNKKRLKQE